MHYNCCQVPGICSENEISQPTSLFETSFKRFTCEFQTSCHGDDYFQRPTKFPEVNRSRRTSRTKRKGRQRRLWRQKKQFDGQKSIPYKPFLGSVMFLCLKTNTIKLQTLLSPSSVQYCLLECLRHAEQLLVFCLYPIIAFSWRAEIFRKIIMIVQIVYYKMKMDAR